MFSKKYRITGTAPTLFHNARLADPLNPIVRQIKELTSKRKKTDADHEEIARLEFIGCFYIEGSSLAEGEDIGFPGGNIERMLMDAGKHVKLGTTVKKALLVPEFSPLLYKGPREPKALWDHGGFSLRASVKVTTSRTIRTRPCFRDWALEFTAIFDENTLNPNQVDELVDIASKFIGLGDWRPKYGRFNWEAVGG